MMGGPGPALLGIVLQKPPSKMIYVWCIQLIMVRAAAVWSIHYYHLLTCVCKYKKSIYLSLSLWVRLKMGNLLDISVSFSSSLISTIHCELTSVCYEDYLRIKLLHNTRLQPHYWASHFSTLETNQPCNWSQFCPARSAGRDKSSCTRSPYK